MLAWLSKEKGRSVQRFAPLFVSLRSAGATLIAAALLLTVTAQRRLDLIVAALADFLGAGNGTIAQGPHRLTLIFSSGKQRARDRTGRHGQSAQRQRLFTNQIVQLIVHLP